MMATAGVAADAPAVAHTVVVENLSTLTVVAASSPYWEFFSRFGASAFALLAAGWFLTYYNHQFLRSERRHKIADSYCANLETSVADYLKEKDGEIKRELANKYYAYLEALSVFYATGKDIGDEDKLKITSHYYKLMDLDNAALPDARIRDVIQSLAHIRHILTQ